MPHIYQSAEAALSGLSSGLNQNNHSLIVSGESGAGKTVSAKHIMKYLVTVSNKSTTSCQDVGNRIEQKILESNPILEAFGNASTLRNHNSSRFGKYIQLQFNRLCELEGATIQTYLLEKTRVIHQSAGECNFHIFYQILQAISEPDIAELLDVRIDDPENIHHFQLAHPMGRDKHVDKVHWNEVKHAFKLMGFSKEAQRNIYKILCALLHLGNVTMCPDAEDEEISVVMPENEKHIKMACCILGIDKNKLEQTLSYKRIAANHKRRQSVFYRPCTTDQANRRIDCLIKLLYDRLFKWLVDMINHNITAIDSCKFIGILDIYGFESFQDNSLEQLCINYANEKLQQHFVIHFLKDLQADYAKEAIPWKFTEFQDNKQCLDMLEANTGLFALLDEECQLNRTCINENLCERILSVLSSTSYIQRARKTNVAFVVRHYAGSVQYNISSFVEKNKDDVPAELIELLQQSTEPFLISLFENMSTMVPSGGKKKKCVLAKFKSSLDSLMSVLESTVPHYVRCIKPNHQCVPGLFDQSYVLVQLKACGIIETVEISQKAYPARLGYEDFLQRYGVLLHSHSLPADQSQSAQTALNKTIENKENELLFEPLDLLYRKQLNMADRRTTPKKKLRRRADLHQSLPGCEKTTGLSSADHTRKLCASIMCVVFGNMCKEQPTCSQFGKTKIFLKSGQLELLESQRAHVLSGHVFTIQCAWRRYQTRKRKRLMKAVTLLQAVIRSWRVRCQIRQQHRAASRIQRAYRNHLLHKIHEQVSTSNETPSVYSTPLNSQCHDGDQSVIECHSPRIGALVSSACITQASYLEENQHNDSIFSGQTPHFTPKSSRKPKHIRDQTDTPHIPRNQSNLRDVQKAPNDPEEGDSYEGSCCDVAEGYLLRSEHEAKGITYHVIRSPHPEYPGSKPVADIFRAVSAAVSAAFITRNRFHLAGAFTGIPYFEAERGILSRRRLPRVQIKFHTRPNALLRYGHYIHQKELQCSLADCLD